MAPLATVLLILAGPALAGTIEMRPVSDVNSYLYTTNDTRKWFLGNDDNQDKLVKDAELAAKAYTYLRGKAISTKDDQTFTSVTFFMNTGSAKFNPDGKQTAALRSRIEGHPGQMLQVDLIYWALESTDGNMTMAMGSLAELFCENRREYIPRVADMSDARDGKNYYRYAGAFIGLHGWTARVAGMTGAYANIGGNPIVYAGYEVYDSWKSFFTTGKMKGIDTLKTLGPQGNGNLVDKGGELHMGFGAAETLRGKF